MEQVLLIEYLTPSTGQELYVREGLITKLHKAQEGIAELFDGGTLDVVYGYRSHAVQISKFEEIKSELRSKYAHISEDELSENAHKFIASPDVAGHPTGGAVDVRVLDNAGRIVHMGTHAQQLDRASYVFNTAVSQDVWLNRQHLRIAMCAAGFAPFDGEWWHFSYGDREWAAFYQKAKAVYNQLELNFIK